MRSNKNQDVRSSTTDFVKVEKKTVRSIGADGTKRRLSRRAVVGLSIATCLIVGLATTVGIAGPKAFGAALGLTTPGSPSGTGTGSTTTTTSPDGNSSVNSTPENLAPAIALPGGSTPGHGSFNAISCSGVSTCLAVGADDNGLGVISSTANAGQAWSDDKLPPGISALDAIDCISNSSCVAVGQGAILHTTNGGSSWTYETPSAQTTLLAVTCATSTVCISTGVSPNPTGAPFGVIMRSTDGGVSWTAINLGSLVSGLEAVTCATVTHCIAVGSQIWTTDDAGLTWQQEFASGGIGSLQSVACASTTYCVAIGANPEGLSEKSAQAFAVVTQDGGGTWNQLTLPDGSAALHTVTCPTATSCIAAGPNQGGTYQGSPTYSTSSDGGKTWTATTPPTGISDVAGLACSSANSCVVVGRTGTTSVSAATTDGKSWSPTALPAVAST